MADVTDDLSALYSPLGVPGAVGGPAAPTIVPQQTAGSAGFTAAQQAMIQQTSGGGVQGGRSGGIFDPNLPVPENLLGYDPTEDSAWYKSPEKAGEAFIPEVATGSDKSLEAYHKASEEGIDMGTSTAQAVAQGGLGAIGDMDKETGKITGDTAAKAAQTEERKTDREKRKELFKSGEISRKTKRRLRRAQRGSRKEAWRAYKGDKDLEALELSDELA